MSLPITKFAAVIPHYRNPGPLPATERLASGVAGASLFISGWKRGGFTGLLLAAAGADLLYRGLRGSGHVYEMIPRGKRRLLASAKSQQDSAPQEVAA